MKSGEHAFIFSLPQRNVSFTFTVNPEQIAKMGPKKRAGMLNGLTHKLQLSWAEAMGVHASFDEWLRVNRSFRDFKHEVIDFAASGIGEVK